MDEAIAIATQWRFPQSYPMKKDKADALNLQERMQQLNAALLDTVDRLQLDDNSEMAPEAHDLLSYTRRERLHNKIQQSKTLLKLINRLTEVDRALGDVDKAIEQHDFVAAANGIIKMEKLVQGLDLAKKTDRGISKDAKVIRVVEVQVQNKKDQLLDQLTRYFASTVVWKDYALKVATCMSDDVSGTTVDERRREFWKASEMLGILAFKLKELAKAVSQHLITPLLQIPSDVVKQIEDDGDVVLKVVLQGVKGDNASVKSVAAHVQDTCANVVKVLQFVYVELFACNAELMNHFEASMWKFPGNLEAKLLNFLQEHIPQDVTALDAYQEALMTTIESLENNLMAVGFRVCSNSLLRGFVDQLSELHANNRRQAILSNGRDLIRHGYNNPIEVMSGLENYCPNASAGLNGEAKCGVRKGIEINPTPDRSRSKDVESSCFEAPNCCVTVCAHEVVKLVLEILEEACVSGETSAFLLFKTARDLFFLFRTMVSTLYDQEIANDPRTCMLYHNDCLYMAYHMLVIGQIYQHRLPAASLNQTATMVDMVPSFREVGERALTLFVSSQMEAIMSGMKTNLLSRGALDSGYNFERVEEFLKSALRTINGLSSLWHEGLPRPVYTTIISRMLEPLVQNVVDGVLTQSTISDHRGARLHNVLSLLLESVSLFASPAEAAHFVPSIKRLSKLTAILMDPLATIRDKFKSGNLDAFSSKELAVLVRSLFSESSEQKEFIQELLLT